MKTEKKSRQFPLRDRPDILEILLKDRTTKNNIKWATNDYEEFGFNLNPETEIDIRWLTNGLRNIVQPRVKKDLEIQQERTKEKAEVFTPTWIVEKQVNYVDKEFENLSLEKYINKTWLEITCGEAPYICTRYDSTTGEPLPIDKRVGFLDKKLNRISKETQTKEDWLNHTTKAYQTTYGYEYHGDSLLIARENLLFTFIDYYIDKFNELPEEKTLKNIANIISYNIIQMDGLNYTIPYSSKQKTVTQDVQLDLFKSLEESEEQATENIQVDTNAKIKLWNTNKTIKFNQLKTEGQDNMKFDVVIGNPPYDDGSRQQIYTDFYVNSRIIGKISCLIFPQGWQQPKNANNLSKMNTSKIKRDPQIVKIINIRNAFSNVPGALNTNIILWRKGYDNKLNGKQKIITEGIEQQLKLPIDKSELPKPDYIVELAEKVLSFSGFKSFQDIISKRKPYGLATDYARNSEKYNLPVPKIDKEYETDLRIFTNKGFIYVDKNFPFPNVSPHFEKYKIFVPYAWGNWREESGLGGAFSDIFVAKPFDSCVETYLEVGPFNTPEEAYKMAKYMFTTFFRGLLYINKYSQHSTTAFGAIPIQDFSENWWDKSVKVINDELFKKYNISNSVKKLVDDNVQTKTEENIVVL